MPVAGQPIFLLQIVTPEGERVRLPGGGHMERDLIAAITAGVSQRIGPVTTRARVEAAVREAATKAIYELKLETVKVVAP
jgi:hypothetical protein